MLIGVATLVLGLIGNFVFSSIGIASSLWTIALFCFADLIFTAESFSNAPKIPRLMVDAIIVGILWIPSYPFVHDEYRRQHAALYEGELRPRPDGREYGSQKPILGTASGGFGIIWDPHDPQNLNKPMMSIGTGKLSDRITLYKVENKIKFSTTVRDKNGNLIVEIIDNRWRVSKSETSCWDKNYNDDSLEVKDGLGRVVLQVRIFPNEVRLQAEWPSTGNTFVQSGMYTEQDGIVPRFKYPSKDHWAELNPDSGYIDAK